MKAAERSGRSGRSGDGGIELVVAAVDAPDDQNLFEAGAYGDLMRRTKKRLPAFSFTWRNTKSMGRVEGVGDGMRLLLRSDLARLPFSAENAAQPR